MKRIFIFLTKMSSLISLLLILCLLIFCSSLYAKEKDYGNRITPAVKAISKVLPSVVNLSTEKVLSRSFSPWGGVDPFESDLDDFFSGQTQRKAYSLGSGSIIDSSGLIITNSHVVHRASRIHVTLSDGRRFSAREIANDALNDLALLKLTELPKVAKFKCIATAEPNDLLLGETVIAVGNPYGLGNSISKGVLSATGRKVTFQGKVIFGDILQTDTAVYPGNSGGPLINLNGEMIGMNTAIHKEAKGIGFAIPLMRIENILAGWLIPERFENVSMGIIPGVRQTASGNEFYIVNVMEDSPAWKAGLRKNMILTEFNGRKIDDLLELSRKLFRLDSGEKVSFKASGKTFSFKLEDIKLLDGKALAEKRLGLTVQVLTKTLAESLGYPFDGGLVISEITNGNGSIKRGDILAGLGDTTIHNASDIAKALRNKHYGDEINGILISVIKRGKQIYLAKKIVKFKLK